MRQEQGCAEKPLPVRNRNHGQTDRGEDRPPGQRIQQWPAGGDQQIGAKIVEGQIDFMIFLWDPLEAQPHDPDVKALLRIAVVYDIPIANNLATADFMLNSKFMNDTYSRRVENFNKTIQERVEKMK